MDKVLAVQGSRLWCTTGELYLCTQCMQV